MAVGLAVNAGCTPGSVAEVTADEAEAGAAAASCDVREVAPEGDPLHLDPDGAPPAAELYVERPASSGPHFGDWVPVDVYSDAIDERAVVHNLEHGAVAAWYDPATVAEDDVDQLIEWAQARNQAGLANRAGAGIIVSPFDGELAAPLAFRAWLVAADCQAFNASFADGFLLEHFGEAGAAPEGGLAPDVTRIITPAGD